ncbi:hypothetical protein [Pseudovibrio sp. Tun.PSC04-5.I4]|uniref:hypothetical protein n=1 Tax=Pseudovibrio sp. Tun.PSC04-5.I4 TaxID=1798213 RepID=UPI0013562D39|nr:hypothetical protein [Pseudovibrio sp. Tun.PSC04-5.I4]
MKIPFWHDVNLEACVVVTNHHNWREIKAIWLVQEEKAISTSLEKFSLMIGDNCKIGPNSVID